VSLRSRAFPDSSKGQIASAGEVGLALLGPLLDGSPIIVIGFRGAVSSIMEGIFSQNEQGRLDFPHRIVHSQ
jgi:hypothetical protein